MHTIYCVFIHNHGEPLIATAPNNTYWHSGAVTRTRRHQQNGHKSAILWFTGLSGAGKSTIAYAAEEALHCLGCRTFVLDGDNVRHGLCADLGFSVEDRRENIRRVGETNKLFMEAGVIALTALISPFRADREFVRQMVGTEEFLEIYVKCSLDICESRDVKGLYRLARAGKLKSFTGISSPYEEPLDPQLTLDTSVMPVHECVEAVLTLLTSRIVIEETRVMQQTAAANTFELIV